VRLIPKGAVSSGIDSVDHGAAAGTALSKKPQWRASALNRYLATLRQHFIFRITENALKVLKMRPNAFCAEIQQRFASD
jgi:hypothetical protein